MTDPATTDSAALNPTTTPANGAPVENSAAGTTTAGEDSDPCTAGTTTAGEDGETGGAGEAANTTAGERGETGTPGSAGGGTAGKVGSGPAGDGSVLLAVEDLHVRFAGRARLVGRRAPAVRAVRGVSFELAAGATFGLVGESGSGKSTVARAVLDLIAPTTGRILVGGRDLAALSGHDRLGYRKRVQAVLQDPYSSLNPVHDISVVVGDAITRHHGIARGPARDQAVAELLDLVGLPADLLDRYPRELSGGQRQRVSIARALAVEPDLLIADEPTSALDVSVQSQIVNLLRRIQQQRGLALLVIGHDLDVVKHLSHDVGVMYAGHLIETGPAEALYHGPTHPYTEMLITSIPSTDPAARTSRQCLRRTFNAATTPNPRPEAGCPFAERCPAAFEPCLTAMPEPSPAHHGGTVRCHLHTTGADLAGRPVTAHLHTIGDRTGDQPGNHTPRSTSR